MAPCDNVLSSVQKQSHTARQTVTASICLILALTGLIPIARACHFLFTSGVDIPSNDDVIFLNLISRMGESHYNWLNYFRDTLINGHSFAVGLALFWLNCKLTAASQSVMIAVGLLLLFLRVLLLNNYLFGKYKANVQLVMLPVLCFVLFAPSQTSVLAHPTFGVTWQLSLLTSVFSLWVISQWQRKTLAKAASALSAITGCWTAAMSLTVLPFLFAQDFLNGSRKLRDYAWLIATSAFSLAPYLVSFTVKHDNNRSIAEQIVGFSPLILMNILGRPFANGTGANFGHLQQSFSAGLFGLLITCVLVFIALKYSDKEKRKEVLAPSIICLLMGFLTTALIATTRPFVAPTNSSVSSLFWCGLIGLALYCFKCSRRFQRVIRPCALALLLSILIMTLAYSKTFNDKQYYLDNRAPFAASMVRHYANAPTFATRMIFKLVNMEPYTLGIPLEKNAWSVFAPHREYLLQGDFALPSVELQRTNGGRIFWVKDSDAKKSTSWKSYSHLNLALQGESTLNWKINIPEKCTSAVLHCKLLKKSSEYDSLRSLVFIKHKGNARGEFASANTKDSIDLKELAGQAVTVCFRHTGAGTCVFEYPRLEVIAPPDPPQADIKFAPANVSNSVPLPTQLDYSLQKVDDQRLSLRTTRTTTNQELQSLQFQISGKQGLVNCVVRYKDGQASVYEIPIFASNKPALYTLDGRYFDDSQAEIAEISLVNNSPGALSDYVTSAHIKY